MRWFHAARARLRLLSRRSAESRFDSEIRFHVEMETERLMREEKLDASEARRRALVAFGGVEQHREALREGRGTAWFSGLSLDLKCCAGANRSIGQPIDIGRNSHDAVRFKTTQVGVDEGFRNAMRFSVRRPARFEQRFRKVLEL